jgi:integrase/recombinase XerC
MTIQIPSLSKGQAAALIAYLRDRSTKNPVRIRNRRDEVLILLMLEAGLRVSEAINLPYSAAYWQGKPRPFIEISNAIAKYGIGGSIPVTAPLRTALSEFIPQELLEFVTETDQPIVDHFTWPRHLCRRQAARIVDQASQASIGIHAHPHMLRHTFGNTMRSFCDLPTLQALMRHKHLSSTEVYMHPTIEDATKAATALDKSRERIIA